MFENLVYNEWLFNLLENYLENIKWKLINFFNLTKLLYLIFIFLKNLILKVTLEIINLLFFYIFKVN
jgi:hypothetical protein